MQQSNKHAVRKSGVKPFVVDLFFHLAFAFPPRLQRQKTECNVKIPSDTYSVVDKCTYHYFAVKISRDFNEEGDRTTLVIVINSTFKLHPRKCSICSTWNIYPAFPLLWIAMKLSGPEQFIQTLPINT